MRCWNQELTSDILNKDHKHMKKLLILFGLLVPVIALGQNGLRIGYGAYYGNLKDMNRVIYIYNQTGNFSKPMNYLRATYGLSVAWVVESSDFGMELKWQNRHRVIHSEWIENNERYRREVKFRSNFLSYGFYGISDNTYYGMSFDLGNFKAWTRRGIDTEIDQVDYDKVFVMDHEWLFSWQFGNTFFIGFRAGPVAVRFSYQLTWLTRHLDHIDNYLIGGNIEDYNSLEDKYDNLGIELLFTIGGDR